MNKTEAKNALVTGGTRGIGHAIASRLSASGAKVHITGRRKNPDISSEFIYHQVDFTDESSVKRFLEYIAGSKIEILVNNAGINIIDDFCDIKIPDFDAIQKVNLSTPFQICQAVIPNMKYNNWGRIINIASIWGCLGKRGRAAYSASKFGIDGMTASLAAEVAKYGILVNSVSPGFIYTDLTREILGEHGMKEVTEQIPMGRLGQPHEIAELVSWLVSMENSYISGQNIIIDGGFTRV